MTSVQRDLATVDELLAICAATGVQRFLHPARCGACGRPFTHARRVRSFAIADLSGTSSIPTAYFLCRPCADRISTDAKALMAEVEQRITQAELLRAAGVGEA